MYTLIQGIYSFFAWLVLGFNRGDKDFCLFSFFSLIAVFYFIEADRWLKPQVFIPGRRLAQIIGC